LLGAGHTAPNPMVGSVLVYEDRQTGEERIIGEGYHERYGQRHAEANCVASVKEEDRPLIAQSTLYVSLEPCAHYGKQPPCADLIIDRQIPRVVVGCRDPFPQVNGKGIEKLLAAGVEVRIGVLEKECIDLNRRFLTFNTLHRPYIVLKWAQSANGKIAGADGNAGAGIDGGVGNAGARRTLISNEYTNRLVHKWRSEEAAILVGTRTALADDPALTARLWSGPDPIRLVIDKDLRLPDSLRLFDRKVRTIVFNTLRHEETDNLLYYQLATDSSLVDQVVVALTALKIQSVLVEGGARLLQSFIDEGYWDEARVITNNDLEISGGLAAPVLKDGELRGKETLLSDSIRYYKKLLR
jgi:diaminohydroxyphosphoribosylaminopyrimidine deaminase/5-amino-6-(5-phosphoribosylamino)uracil reductase